MSLRSRRPFRVLFLIVPSLTRRRFPGADDSRPRCPLREANDQKTLVGRMPNDQLAILVRRMIRIVKILASGSAKTVKASSKATPCFLRFSCAFSASHSNSGVIGSFRAYHDRR